MLKETSSCKASLGDHITLLSIGTSIDEAAELKILAMMCTGVPEMCEMLYDSFFDPHSNFETLISHLGDYDSTPAAQVIRFNIHFQNFLGKAACSGWLESFSIEQMST